VNNKGTKRSFGSIRALKSGRFQARYSDPYGRDTSAGTFSTRAQAEKRLSDIRYAIDTGTWDERKAVEEGALDPRTVTLSQLAEHYRATHLTSKGKPVSAFTESENRRYVEKVLAELKDKPIRMITSAQIEKWYAPEYRRVPNQTAKVYKHLKTLMQYAVKRKLITSSPCDIDGAGIHAPAVKGMPTLEQVQIIIEHAQAPFGVLVAIAAWGGLRRGEVLALQRKDLIIEKDAGETWITIRVDKALTWHAGGRVQVGDPKSAYGFREVLVPQRITPLLLKHLNTVPINPEALLFSRDAQAVEHWRVHQSRLHWNRARALSGYQGDFHDLRRFHLSQYSALGANNVEIMARGGHGDIKTAMIYQRPTGRERELVRMLG
jgi:integrase